MTIRRLAITATALLLPFAVASCGSNDTSELDRGELVDVLEKAGMDQSQSGCMADALIDAGLTKDELDTLAKGDAIADTAKAEQFTTAANDCLQTS